MALLQKKTFVLTPSGSCQLGSEIVLGVPRTGENLKGRLGVKPFWCECPLPFLLLHGVFGVDNIVF